MKVGASDCAFIFHEHFSVGLKFVRVLVTAAAVLSEIIIVLSTPHVDYNCRQLISASSMLAAWSEHHQFVAAISTIADKLSLENLAEHVVTLALV